MGSQSIDELFKHEGHNVNLASWAEGESYTLACGDCEEILLEFYQDGEEITLYPPSPPTKDRDYYHVLVELEQELQNLLAVVHRDGGNYTSKHGRDKSLADAEHEVLVLHGVSDWVTSKAKELGWSEEANCLPYVWLNKVLDNQQPQPKGIPIPEGQWIIACKNCKYAWKPNQIVDNASAKCCDNPDLFANSITERFGCAYDRYCKIAWEHGVDLYLNDETGDWLWSVVPHGGDAYWLWSFPDEDKARDWCRRMGFKIKDIRDPYKHLKDVD